MSFKKFASGLLRLTALIAILGVVLTQSVGVHAQGDTPGKDKTPMSKVSLAEVENFYGRLADTQSRWGVVVELSDRPSALVYAETQGELQTSALVKDQTNVILQRQASFMSALQADGIRATELYRTQKVFNGIWMQVDKDDIQKLATLPGVKAIYPIIPKEIDHTTSVPLIGAPAVWAGSGAFQGDGISIGIIDTGVDYAHTNFGGPGVYTGLSFPTAKVVGGWDFAGDDYDANDADPIIAPDADPMDCNGHGTHVAGTAAGYGVLTDGSTYVEGGGDTYAALSALSATDYQSKFRIGPGVAPKADLYALRVFGCAGSTNLTEQAIEWAMDPNGDGNFEDHLDVINMSLGSSFGSENDTSAIAANNAAQAGIIVVASAGNSSDIYYITGAPAVARYAISVANSVDGGAVVSAMEVTAAPSMTPGLYAAVEADFGSVLDTTGLTGDLVLAVDGTGAANDGCQTLTNAADVAGKIALIDRGSCTFQVKVENAEAAGAIGALIANNVDGFPFVMAGTSAGIPAMMTSKGIGTELKANLSGTVTVRLTSEYRDQFLMTDPAVEDMLSSSSSRGVARGTSLLKPDLAAPGDSIYSSLVGSGNLGVSYGGTSMASPHVAGMMALLREIHPDWSVSQLKALAMNTATNDIYKGLNQSGSMYTPSRIGAGRVSVPNAAETEVIAYYKNDPGLVSLSFGQVPVVGTKTLTKIITISNTGSSAADYDVTFDSRYAANPGLTFTLLDASGAALSNPVSVPAGATLDIKLQVDLDSSLLEKALDPTVATSTSYGQRQRFSEGGGYVTLTSTGSAPTLRVPAYIAARPASSMSVSEDNLDIVAPSGTAYLTPQGTPVDTADDSSLVTILELKDESPNDSWSTGTSDSADLKYVGIGSDYPYWGFADSAIFFGMATYGKWDTPQTVEFDIYVDSNEDGVEDYVIFNYNTGVFTGSTDDVIWSIFCPIIDGSTDYDLCDAWYKANMFSGSTNTNIFNTNVMTLLVPPEGIGLEEGVNTDFNFYVVTWHRDAAGWVDLSNDWMSYDLANQPFEAVDPYYIEEPVWYDYPGLYANGFEINYDVAAIAASESKGLLLLHHHNASKTDTAEVVNLLPVVASIDRANINPTASDTVNFTVNFSRAVSGVDVSDFALQATGVSGAAIQSVSGYDAEYTVTVSTGTGDGTLGLNLTDDDSIVDSGANPLAGTGTGNGDFIGAVYNVLKTPTFGDVNTSYWAWSYIETLSRNGITTGCGANSYCPDNPVTRAQMAVFLLRSIYGASYTPPAAAGTVFDDVTDPNDFYAPWIEQLAAEGITTGCGNGNYCPDAFVTRASMSIFLLRGKYTSAYAPTPASGTIFIDVPVTYTPYAPWIEQLAREGITSGCGGNSFCPDATVTRAQMAVFLVRTFALEP